MLNQEEIFKRVAAGTLDKMEALEMLKNLNESKEEEVQETQETQETVEQADVLDEIKNEIVDIVCDILHLDSDSIDEDSTFKQLGVDSISGIEIIRDINKTFSINLDSVTLYDYATIEDMASHIAGIMNKEEAKSATEYSEKYEKESGLEEIYHDKHYKEMRGEFINKLGAGEEGANQHKPKIQLTNLKKKN